MSHPHFDFKECTKMVLDVIKFRHLNPRDFLLSDVYDLWNDMDKAPHEIVELLNNNK